MKKTLFSLILIAFGITINAQTTYVNINATGANNGTSWADAYTDLHSATFNTTSGEIWVAAGTYVPSRSYTGNIPANNRQKTFRIQNNVQVYGGFNGTETLLSQRNWSVNVTTLSANVGGGLFAYNVVRFDANNNTTVLDGFTISQGQAGGTGAVERFGGAIHATTNASPTIRNCKFLNNTANQSGGAIYAAGGSLQIFNCEFKNNGTTVFDGGAIYLTGTSAVNIGNCLFASNTAGRHAAAILTINSTTTTVFNSTFVSNVGGAGGTGNAILISATTSGSATVKNCVFYNNTPNANDVTYGAPATLSIQNCFGSTLSGTSMSNNISGNPKFTDFANGDFTLSCESPAVNTGDATGLTLPTTDLNGNPRTLNTIDMGAYENQVTSISVSANKTVICAGDYVVLRGSCDNVGYTWSNGVTDNVAFYPTATQTYTCTGTGSSTTATITIEVVNITNENLSGPTNVCAGTPATITLANSASGAQYFLRDNATDYIVDGPVTGTGSALNFTTNNLYSTTTYNIIGNSNPTVAPVAGVGLDFDGSNDKITTNYFFPTTNNLSIEAWIYPESSSYARILTSFSGGVNNTSDIVFDTYNASAPGTSLRLVVGTSTTASVPNVLTLNTWSHVAATFNSGVITFYVNGNSVGTFTVATTTLLTNSTRSLTIGEDFSQGPASEYFNGKMDEIRIWKRTLTQSEIAANMNECLTGPQNQLEVYYKMDEATGTLINDFSGNAHTGTFVNNTANTHWITSTPACNEILTTSTSTGYALDFDGTNDMVVTNFKMPATSVFSIEGWVYPRSTNYDRLFSNYSAAVNGNFIIDTYNATPNNGMALRFNVYGTGNTLFSVGAANVLTLNAWNHVACTFSNGTMTAYVNGFEIATGTAPFTSIPQITNYLCFGEDFVPGAAEYLNGKLDEIRVWNKALSQTDILNNMNICLTGTETNLLAYYNFEDGAGSVVSDITIDENNGLMQNMDANTDWVAGKFTCETTCSLEMTQTLTVNVTTVDKTVTATSSSVSANQVGATYQWLDCNNGYATLSGETSQTLNPTSNGSYAVAVTFNSCTDTSACTVFSTISLQELGTINFNLFPNPTNNELNITTNENVESIVIYNLLGEVVQTETKSKFSVEQLTTGVYTIQVKTNKGIGTKRFIKN